MATDRIGRLAAALGEAGVDAFFASTSVSMNYLHGYPEEGHERFLALAINADGKVAMICPSLSATQASRAGIQDLRAWCDGEDPLLLLEQLAKEWNLKSAILAVDDEMKAKMLLDMQATLPAALFKPGGSVLAKLMSRKDPSELELMRRAGKIADEAFVEVLLKIRKGMTERQVERLLREAMANRGGTPTFCIVGVGPGSAEPHHENGDTPVAEGQILLMDFGCSLEGYQSDITRTVNVGRASDKAKQVYEIVYRAHMAAREAIRPGATGEDIDNAARQVIEAAGYGPQFFHRLGHGIGMRGHEEPNMVVGNTTPLEPGNCFSIEPGIYLAGEFGVRIENIVASTAEGHESMNADPSPTLLEIG